MTVNTLTINPPPYGFCVFLSVLAFEMLSTDNSATGTMNWGYDTEAKSDERLAEIDFIMNSSDAFLSAAAPLVAAGGLLHEDIHACHMVRQASERRGRPLAEWQHATSQQPPPEGVCVELETEATINRVALSCKRRVVLIESTSEPDGSKTTIGVQIFPKAESDEEPDEVWSTWEQSRIAFFVQTFQTWVAGGEKKELRI